MLRDISYTLYKVFTYKEDVTLERDTEFYYLIGQILAYIINRTDLDNEENSEIEVFIYLEDIDEIKESVVRLYDRYYEYLPENHPILLKALELIDSYKFKDTVVNRNTMFSGYLRRNIIEYLTSPEKDVSTEK